MEMTQNTLRQLYKQYRDPSLGDIRAPLVYSLPSLEKTIPYLTNWVQIRKALEPFSWLEEKSRKQSLTLSLTALPGTLFESRRFKDDDDHFAALMAKQYFWGIVAWLEGPKQGIPREDLEFEWGDYRLFAEEAEGLYQLVRGLCERIPALWEIFHNPETLWYLCVIAPVRRDVELWLKKCITPISQRNYAKHERNQAKKGFDPEPLIPKHIGSMIDMILEKASDSSEPSDPPCFSLSEINSQTIFFWLHDDYATWIDLELLHIDFQVIFSRLDEAIFEMARSVALNDEIFDARCFQPFRKISMRASRHRAKFYPVGRQKEGVFLSGNPWDPFIPKQRSTNKTKNVKIH